MTIIDKAKAVVKSNSDEELVTFCHNLFNKGKDWLDVETLITAAGGKKLVKRVYEIYETWQEN